MSNGKEASKRQARKAQMRRREQRSRLLGIGLITIGALFVAFLIIWPMLRPVGSVNEPPVVERPNVDFNKAGSPEAPIKIVE